MPPSLIDQFGRRHNYLRISVTDRCNLRCVYCMPAEGLVWRNREDLLTYEEIERLARIFANLGVTKIRLTGGEPLLRQDIERLIKALASIKGVSTLAMTTNGVLLKEKAQIIRDSGLNAVNISLDTLKPLRFERIVRRSYFADVLGGIDKALAVGFDEIKLNVVVLKGLNEDELLDFVDFVKDKPMNIRFIEYMPFHGNGWKADGLVPYVRMKDVIQKQYALTPILTEPSAVAKDYALDGYKGTVSFITSMSDSFCSNCNRIRLTAEGGIKPCLHDATEVSLREMLRQNASDEAIALRIQTILFLKQQEHLPMEELARNKNKSMIQIGG